MGFDARQKRLIGPIAALALPAIVTNITVPLLGLCDIAIAGHKGGAAFIASLAVATSMFNLIYWLLGFLRMGSSGLTAQAFGSGDSRRAALVLFRGMAVAGVASAVIIALQRPVAALLLAAMDVDGDTASAAGRYFAIAVWGAPAVLGNYALTGWFLGMQNSHAPMAVSIAADLVNIAVSLVLVFVAGLDIEGVATGTLVAQWISFLLAAIIAVRRYHPPLPLRSELFEPNGLSAFFKVNRDIFLRTLCLAAVTMWFTRAGARQGELMLAVNALIMQMFTIFSYFMDGFAFSAEALVGRFIGARDAANLRATIAVELKIGFVVALFFTVCYALGGNLFLSLLTDDSRVLATASDYRWWAATIPLAGFMAFAFDGIFIGATATRHMLISMATSMCVFFALWLSLSPWLGNHSLWLAFCAYLLQRGLYLRHAVRKLSVGN